MLLSRQLANFTRGESDALRKAMGKKKKDIVDAMKPKFIEGGKANGHDPKVLDKIWGDWEKFASYAFNKSHAACYSWVAYQTAYLKAHYPAEFMAALLTRRSSDIKEITKLMEECKDMGINTLGPNVNESHIHFSANKEGHIRFGLAGIKGVGEGAVQVIIDERNANGAFTDIYNFVERVNLNTCNRKNLECLIVAGAFDLFDVPREQYFGPMSNGTTFLDTLVSYGQRFQTEQNESSMSLFGGFDAVEIQKPKLPEKYEQWTDLERLNREKELVSIYLSGHPLDNYAVILKHVCTLTCPELPKVIDNPGQSYTLGGIVTNVEQRFTKMGLPWGIVRIDDFEGSGELRLFGDSWMKFRNYFILNNSVLVTGTVTPARYGNRPPDFVVTNVENLAEVRDKKIRSITILCSLNAITDSTVTDLLNLVQHPDNRKVYESGATAGGSDPMNSGMPCNVELRFVVLDSMQNTRVTLGSRTFHIPVTKALLDYLETNSELDYIVNG